MVKRLNRAAIPQRRDAILGIEQPRKEDSPGGKRQQGTDRSTGGVNHIGQCFSGNLLLVRQLSHTGAQCHDIQVIIHKNQDSHDPGHKKSRFRPPAQSSKKFGKAKRTMGCPQQSDQTSEQRTHHKHPLMITVGSDLKESAHPGSGKAPAADDDIGNDSACD